MNFENLKPCIKSASQKLKYIFEQGYLPSRCLSLYNKKTLEITNCFGHACTNLTNELLSKFTYDEGDVFSLINWGDIRAFFIDETINDALNSFNLNISPCQITDLPDNKSWKVALYTDSFNDRDYHFYKYEQENLWSHKLGFDKGIAIALTPPNKIYDLELFDFYMITNNNGKELSEKQLKDIELEISQLN